MPIEGPNGPIWTEDDAAFRAARRLIGERGFRPEGQGHTVSQLAAALAAYGWSWTLGDTAPADGPARVAAAKKAFRPPVVGSYGIARVATTDVAALTMVLADAIRYEEQRYG
jgi:hypothetical protein